jgi:hypothetical protein
VAIVIDWERRAVTDHIDVTRKAAAQRQIDAAIAHLKKFELECAITLAAAAEAMLPDTTTDYVFNYLRRHLEQIPIEFTHSPRA